MKLYTYFPGSSVKKATLETHVARREGKHLVVEVGISGRVVRDEDLDEPISANGSGYYRTPERALRVFIEQGIAAIGLADGDNLSQTDRREWRAAIKTAKEKLAFLGGKS